MTMADVIGVPPAETASPLFRRGAFAPASAAAGKRESAMIVTTWHPVGPRPQRWCDTWAAAVPPHSGRRPSFRSAGNLGPSLAQSFHAQPKRKSTDDPRSIGRNANPREHRPPFRGPERARDGKLPVLADDAVDQHQPGEDREAP